MGNNCTSALKKKDKDKMSIHDENPNNQRRISNISVESVAYGFEESNLNNSENKFIKLNDQLLNNLNILSNSLRENNKTRTNEDSQSDSFNLSPIHLGSYDVNQKNQDKSFQNIYDKTSTFTEQTLNKLNPQCFDKIFTIQNNKTHVIVISSNCNELYVYNIISCKAVRILHNINRPKNVKIINEYYAVVLCNRELNVYNLDEGKLVLKLKGVMNEKMPFYDLHDENYVVALSRNRMYVNMINLKTGNLEITFKVGEDRFLNSLLVSSNGKICVCGDETQKPFPLLVWDLENRKLIYDLRIPNHEFITHLSVISNDGHYVVSVCKEVNINSLNFIVIYDLQSGTLFKKLKLDYNTISITISYNDNCIINGLENNQILIWDLSTGSIRHNLEGHTSPADKLIVADDGKFLLSYDSTLTDKVIRVWDLSTGICIKTYTPEFNLSCCTLSTNGRFLIICPNDNLTIKVISLSEDYLNGELSSYGDLSREGIEFDLR